MIDKLFDIVNCKAKETGAGDLVDCLAWESARFCGFALPYGSIIYCQHPRKKEIVANTEKQEYTAPLSGRKKD